MSLRSNIIVLARTIFDYARIVPENPRLFWKWGIVSSCTLHREDNLVKSTYNICFIEFPQYRFSPVTWGSETEQAYLGRKHAHGTLAKQRYEIREHGKKESTIMKTTFSSRIEDVVVIEIDGHWERCTKTFIVLAHTDIWSSRHDTYSRRMDKIYLSQNDAARIQALFAFVLILHSLPDRHQLAQWISILF